MWDIADLTLVMYSSICMQIHTYKYMIDVYGHKSFGIYHVNYCCSRYFNSKAKAKATLAIDNDFLQD